MAHDDDLHGTEPESPATDGRDGTPDAQAPSPAGVTRRAFLATTAAGAAAVLVGCDDGAGSTHQVDADVTDASDTLDTSLADTSVADTGSDTGVGDVGDTGTDASDTGGDTSSDAVDAVDAVDGEEDLGDATDMADDETMVGPDFDPTSWAEDTARWPQRVQSGAMTDSTVSLWSRTTDDSGMPQTLRVWRLVDRRALATATGELVAELSVTPDANGYLKHTVEGLVGGAWYGYAYFDDVGMWRSTAGRVRLALGGTAREVLTVAAATCSNLSNSPFRALERSAVQDIDLVLHLGDMSYNDGAETPEEFRAHWLETLGDPGYQALLPRAGMYITWDDHEVDNNYNPESMDPAVLAAAKASFFENLATLPGAPDGRLWTSYRWGHTAEFFIIDSRSERVPSTRTSDNPIYIGTSQMAWLRQALTDSPCHFKVLLNSVPITDMPLIYDVQRSDRWEGYDKQRDQLLSHIAAQGITNVWFLSGDFHLGFVARVEPDGMSQHVFEVAVGPTANGPNPAAFLNHPADQFDYVGSSSSAMTLLTFDPNEDSVRVRFVEASNGSDIYEAVLRSTPPAP